MDTDLADILSRHPVPRHRITLEEYHRLGRAGILGEDDRVELLDGQLVDMSPIGPRHALAVDALNRLLVRAVGDRATVRVQNPIELDATTEPQPDFALVREPWRGFPGAHPRPGDVFLLVEIADTSLELDRGAKLALYARAGIREFWIVDVATNSVLVHRRPRGDNYDLVTRVEPPGVLEIEDLAGIQIPAASIFVWGRLQQS
ncbi:MAG: Uma2 family endonuclease [Acetobacteraceae bacterium]|nr:Uma2 family endonuclease [Acetobacteraceae bacterium]